MGGLDLGNYAIFGAGATDKHYEHTQSASATVWVVTHNLEKNPN